jgi:hypothetical protein
MVLFRNIMVLIIWFFPAAVWAEPQKLECRVVFGDFVDVYTVEIDVDKNQVVSTYHAASNKDKSVTLDYKTSSNAIIYEEKIIYNTNLHSLDYIYEINRKTLEIIRYINDVNAVEVGRGPCNVLDAGGKKL